MTVPATACFVSDNSPAESMPYKGGGTYSRFTLGLTALTCPLPVSAASVSSGGRLTKFRVHFRDADGDGSGSQVEVVLNRAFITSRGRAVVEGLCSFDSNGFKSANVYIRTLVACEVVIRPSTFYYFDVLLRDDGREGGEPNFLGIDFP